MHKTEEMTFQALSARADEVNTDYTLAGVIGGEDHREIILFLSYDQSCDMRGDDVTYRLESKRILGLALCDLDDPQAEIEIWDRDTVWERLGRDWVENSEAAQ